MESLVLFKRMILEALSDPFDMPKGRIKNFEIICIVEDERISDIYIYTKCMSFLLFSLYIKINLKN